MSNKKPNNIATSILYFAIGLCSMVSIINTFRWIENIQQSVQSVTLENETLKQEVNQLKETIVELQNNKQEVEELKETINNQQEQINEIK